MRNWEGSLERRDPARSPRATYLDAFISGFADYDDAPRRAKGDLAFFIPYVFVDQRGKPLVLQWFHEEMIRMLLFDKRVLLLLARTFGKSTIASVAYPCWRLGSNRDLRIILASNTLTQARWWLAEIENIMLRNKRYQEVFGYLVPKPRTLRWTDTEKVVLGRSPYAMHASLLAAGVGSALLGMRSDIIVADDIFGKKEAMSQVYAQQTEAWFWETLMPTLEPDGQVVVSGSRWGMEDIYAKIKKRWGALKPEMASWQRGDFVSEGKYPLRKELWQLESEGKLDPHETSPYRGPYGNPRSPRNK